MTNCYRMEVSDNNNNKGYKIEEMKNVFIKVVKSGLATPLYYLTFNNQNYN